MKAERRWKVSNVSLEMDSIGEPMEDVAQQSPAHLGYFVTDAGWTARRPCAAGKDPKLHPVCRSAIALRLFRQMPVPTSSLECVTLHSFSDMNGPRVVHFSQLIPKIQIASMLA